MVNEDNHSSTRQISHLENYNMKENITNTNTCDNDNDNDHEKIKEGAPSI